MKRGDRDRFRVRMCCVPVVATALIMGGPTLRGGFVGGDDHRLVLDHVLVNHPSLEHALELFTIPHRDLYQPLPLLSFSAEFALAVPLGLFDHSVEDGAWLFHLTNVLMHAVNALLVFALVYLLMIAERNAGFSRFQTRRDGISPPSATPLMATGSPQQAPSLAVATIAAVLFAAHPINMEAVAWINGRMMLLSTFFALASLLTLHRWMQNGKLPWAMLTLVCVGCCGLSKIRVSLPLLLLLIPLSLRRRFDRSFLFLWIPCLGITAALAVVNYIASSEAGMFSGAEENLHGPPLVRALLGIAWYLAHLVWPVGLASWYPTPTLVRWSDPATLRSLTIVIPTVLLAAWAARRSRVLLYGFAWFFVSIASTLQLVPNRNVLAADRYMYLPVIGLFMVLSVWMYSVYRHIARRWQAGSAWAAALFSIGIALALILTSWHVGSFYESPVRKCERIVSLFPDTPHVWERLAWAYHKEGRNQDAIHAAEKELRHEDAAVRSEARQVIGTAQLALALEPGGTKAEQVEAALDALRLAREEDPANPMADFRLAAAYEVLGRLDDALRLYEEAMPRAPRANPQLLRLASLYRRLGRAAFARRTFDQVLANNAYDVKATMALAEMDIEDASEQSLESARRRLVSLLDWMPENADAWANLGVALNGLGQRNEAVEAYLQALKNRPDHATAALNLALLYYASGDAQRAAPFFQTAVRSGLDTVGQAVAVHDFLMAQGMVDRTVALWRDQLVRFPDSRQAQAFEAWSLALTGRTDEATAAVNKLQAEANEPTLWIATRALLAVSNRDMESVMACAEQLADDSPETKDARHRLIGALEAFDHGAPANPAIYCLTARLLFADGQTAAALAFAELCKQHCQDPACLKHAGTGPTNVNP